MLKNHLLRFSGHLLLMRSRLVLYEVCFLELPNCELEMRNEKESTKWSRVFASRMFQSRIRLEMCIWIIFRDTPITEILIVIFSALDNRDTNLRTAKVLKGTCPDMCPETERYKREARRLLHPYEMLPATGLSVSTKNTPLFRHFHERLPAF